MRGTTNDISVSLYDADGEPYVLEEGEVLRFGVKSSLKDKTYVIIKDITVGNEQGVYTFSLAPDETQGCDFGIHYYDVGLQSGTDYYNVIECSAFEILYNVTNAAEVTENA